jgi:hypothetical protein
MKERQSPDIHGILFGRTGFPFEENGTRLSNELDL